MFFFGGEGTPYSCFGRCDDDAYSAGDQQIPLWSSQRHLELAVFSVEVETKSMSDVDKEISRLLNYKIYSFGRIHVYVVWMYVYI